MSKEPSARTPEQLQEDRALGLELQRDIPKRRPREPSRTAQDFVEVFDFDDDPEVTYLDLDWAFLKFIGRTVSRLVDAVVRLATWPAKRLYKLLVQAMEPQAKG